MRPAYWDDAVAALSAADPVLGGIIAQHPGVCLASRGDPFATLARSIVGQQISVKAADAVWARVVKACPEMTPDRLRRKRVSTLRACGLSERKVAYVRDLADHFLSGAVDPARFPELDDETIIRELSAIHGIGRWTAEMFLIFNLLRPDVLPLDDLGLLKAVGLHYFDGEPSDRLVRGEGRRRVTALAEAWMPWRSVATWYLWRCLDPVPVEY